MIVFDLRCRAGGESFEAWFSSNADYEGQAERGLVECPFCQSRDIEKAPMAPAIPKTRAQEQALKRIAMAQAELLKSSEYVGDRFADTARAMHKGEMEPAPVHGQANLSEAKALIDDGVPIAPLPLPVVPPRQVN
jgi:hypothetical protein